MASFDEALRVVDADTFKTADGTSHRILGIDAPEAGTPAGDAATAFSRALLESADEASVTPSGKKGYYGRELSDATVDGTDVATRTVRAGHARPTSFDDALGLAESGAVTAEFLGLQEKRVDNETVLDVGGNIAQDFKPRGGTLSRAVGRGVDQFQNLMFSAGNVASSAIGDLVELGVPIGPAGKLVEQIGPDVMANWGLEGMKHNALEAAMNPAEIAEWDDVEGFADLYTYVIEALGEQAINIASIAGSGGAGLLVKGGLTMGVKAAIGKKFSQLALKQGNKLRPDQLRSMGKQMVDATGISGGTIGVAGGSYVLGVGEVGNELREGGIDSPLTALAAAVPFAALDTIGFQHTIGRLFKGIDKGIATQSVKDIAQSTFRAAGLGAAAESSTEMLQEVITLSARAFHDPTFEIFSDENLHRIREAGIKAGIVGAVGGGGATVANKSLSKLLAPQQAEIDLLKARFDEMQAAKTEEPTPTPPSGPPPAAGGAITSFKHRDTDFAYVPEEATIPAAEVYEGAPEDAIVSIRGMLEQDIEPAMVKNESKTNALEALRICLAR